MPNWMEVQKSEDEMQLFLTLYELPDGKAPTTEVVKQELRRQGFQLGIKDEVIAAMLADKVYEKPVVVAEGKQPAPPKPGHYEFFFDTKAETNIPTILEDGTVDYSKNIELVETGTLLAQYHKVSPGEKGYTVTGAIIESDNTMELPMLEMDGVYHEDGKYYASQIGKVTLHNGRLKVDPTLVVDGNVSIAYGNIDFTGDVIIKGDINTGMHVKAGGSITVEGAVEGAKLEAGGDVIIGQGIHGEGKAVIMGDGNLVCKFIETAQVNVLGDLQTGYIINSEVVSEGLLDTSKGRGVIMGGTVCGLKGVIAKNIGHRSHTPTKVFTGATPRDTDLLKRVRMSVKSCKVYIEKLEMEEETLLASVADPEKAMEKNIEFREHVQTIRQEREQIKVKLDKCSEAAEKLLDRIDRFHGCEITVTGMFYGGSSVTISSVEKEEMDDVKAVKFMQDGVNIACVNL